MIPVLNIKTLDDVEVKGKTVLVRVDFNSPVDPVTKKITDDTRIRTHAETTLKELMEKGAKVVVLAHQGRKGDPDFISLSAHAEVLKKILGSSVKFVDDIFGEKARSEINSLDEGELLLLENVRMWDGETKKLSAEEHAKSEMVRALAPLVDVFVVDAFAAAHRTHASLVGFAPVVKEVVAGRVMERELRSLVKVLEEPERPCIYILGGAKAEDSADVVDSVLSKDRADYVLTGGLVANLFLKAKGYDLGKVNEDVLEKKGFMSLIPRIKELLDKYPSKIVLPEDLAIDDGGRKEISISDLPTEKVIKDIGINTAKRYSELIKDAKTIVMNGPMGVFEDKGFEVATKEVFTAISESNAFSLIGGGHTIAAASKLGYLGKFSHVSTGGGALIEYLVKGTLPVIEILKKYSR